MIFNIRNKIEIIKNHDESTIKSHFTFYNNETFDFDFNSIIKIPDELMIEHSSNNLDAVKLYLAKINPNIKNLGNLKDKMEEILFDSKVYNLCDSYEDIKNIIISEREVNYYKNKYEKKKTSIKKVIDYGQKIVTNKEKYSYYDWYDFSSENWGCNFNASNTTVNDNFSSFSFLTPFLAPIKVIKQFAKLHPQMSFIYSYFNESNGKIIEKFTFANGKIIENVKYINH